MQRYQIHAYHNHNGAEYERAIVDTETGAKLKIVRWCDIPVSQNEEIENKLDKQCERLNAGA